MEPKRNAKLPRDDKAVFVELVQQESRPAEPGPFGPRQQARLTWILGILGILCPIVLLGILRFGYWSWNARDLWPSGITIVLSGIAAVWALALLIVGRQQRGVAANAVAGLILNIIAMPLGLCVGGLFLFIPIAQTQIAKQRADQQRQASEQANARAAVQREAQAEAQLLAKIVDHRELGVELNRQFSPRVIMRDDIQIVYIPSGFPGPIVWSADGSSFFFAEYVNSPGRGPSHTCVEEFSLPGFEMRRCVGIRGGSEQLSMCVCSEGLVVCAEYGIQSRLTIFDPASLKPRKEIALDGRCEVYGARCLAPIVVKCLPPQSPADQASSDGGQSGDRHAYLLDLVREKQLVRLTIDEGANMVITPDGKNLLFMDHGYIRRFAVDSESLTKRESSAAIPLNTNAREAPHRLVCNDAEYLIALTGKELDLFAVNELSKPVCVVQAEGTNFSTAAIDPVTKQIYVMQRNAEFFVYSSQGVLVRHVHLQEGRGWPESGARMFVDPRGHHVQATSLGSIRWIEIPSTIERKP